MARNVARAHASVKKGEWKRNKYVGVSLVGKTLVVMGFGKVGSEVARRAKGLGMHVISHDLYAPADRARAIGVELVSFDDAISKADFISFHCGDVGVATTAGGFVKWWWWRWSWRGGRRSYFMLSGGYI
ncbi:D-3-phosphoglycerate dehydrogenase 3, chloroplastic-like [Silene latifolia]|uniref:D-3-phosphoglycerate dehydrogenase 3, chloroplastic-like n=1 Tax=Silene latifolia TaxID=37657 RepID=UPI003D76D791